jgi:hypothetical protein
MMTSTLPPGIFELEKNNTIDQAMFASSPHLHLEFSSECRFRTKFYKGDDFKFPIVNNVPAWNMQNVLNYPMEGRHLYSGT